MPHPKPSDSTLRQDFLRQIAKLWPAIKGSLARSAFNARGPRKFVQMLKDTRALVSQAADQGKNADQMKQEHLLAKYEELGKGFIKTDAWIDLLYAEVTQKAGTAPGYQNHGHVDERK